MTRKIKVGSRIKLKVRTVFGWKGYGIVTEECEGDEVVFVKEGQDLDAPPTLALRHEVSVCRNASIGVRSPA